MGVKEARKQREIDEAQERMRKSGNAEYERALKAWVSSDVRSLVHYVFSSWHDALKEAVREREIEEAQERMAQMLFKLYVRASKKRWRPDCCGCHRLFV